MTPQGYRIAWELYILRYTIRVHAMGGSRGGDNRGSGRPLKNHNFLGFLSNIGPDFLKNHKATKPAFNTGPSSARSAKRH